MKILAGILVSLLVVVVIVGVVLRFIGGTENGLDSPDAINSAATEPTATPTVQAPPLPIQVLVAQAVEPWVRAGAEEYNAQGRTIEGAEVSVEVVTMDGLTAINKWSTGDFEQFPTAWIAESRAWVDRANIGAVDRANRDIFLTGGQYRAQPLVLSPVVWGIWQETMQVMVAKHGSGDISWDEIHEIAVAEDWTVAGGPAEWGKFKLVMTNPKRDPSGLTALVGAAGEYYDKPVITADDLADPEFREWLADMLETVIEFSPFAVENMVLFGRSEGDAGQIVESYLLVNMENFQARWNEPLVIVYPDPISWFDFPYATYMGKETTAAQKQAALDFKSFLLSADQQAKALDFGLRPACVDCPSTGGLIERWRDLGVLETIPSSSRMRPASRVGLDELVGWYEINFEQ